MVTSFFTHDQCHQFSDMIAKAVNERVHKKLKDSPVRLRVHAVSHFGDRLYDRKVDLNKVKSMLFGVVNDKLCELIYAINRDDNFTRIDFLRGDVLIGCTMDLSRTSLTIRTVIAGFNHPSRQKSYVLEV